MVRLIFRQSIRLIIVYAGFIILSISLGRLRYDTLMLYSQPNANGFMIWNLQSERTQQWLPVTSLNLTYISSPTWSPDGGTLAFVGRRTTTHDGLQVSDNLYLADANGRNAQLLWDTSGSPIRTSSQGTHYIRWSPDGEKIALYLDLYGQPQLWLLTSDGRLLTHLASQSPIDDTPNHLPIGARLLWSADSKTLYIVTIRDGLHYQTLSLSDNTTLSQARQIDLPVEVSITNQSLIALAPLSPELLFVDSDADAINLWHLSLSTQKTTAIDLQATTDVTALAWSPSGEYIGWVGTQSEGASYIETLSLVDGQRERYHLPSAIARDRSYRLWLLDSPTQVVTRMQRGSLCRNIGQAMRCFEPDVFSATWYTLRP
ncbi:MAG: hypothetical protein AAFV93_00375 [Chloroflexota bacterium]